MNEHRSHPNPVTLPRYHGIFAALAELAIADHDEQAADLYGPNFAAFYNRFVGQEVQDIGFYRRLLPPGGGTVLDLACGGGRIGIALARLGAHVDGLDTSQHMLALMAENMASEPPTVPQRVRLFQGDMTTLSLPHRYDLIVLGATSLSLLLTAEQRQSLFEGVRDHLAPCGRFAFDILTLGDDKWKEMDHYMDVWSHESDAGVEFAIVGQQFDLTQETFTFNVYREMIGWDGTTQRFLGSSTKAWLKEEDLTSALRRAGLAVVETVQHQDVTFFVSVLAAGES